MQYTAGHGAGPPADNHNLRYVLILHRYSCLIRPIALHGRTLSVAEQPTPGGKIMTDDRFYLPVCGLAVAASMAGLHILATWASLTL